MLDGQDRGPHSRSLTPSTAYGIFENVKLKPYARTLIMKSAPITSNLKRLFTRLRLAAAAMLVLAAGAMALSAASSNTVNTSSKSPNGVYIVRMREAPAVTYKGEIPGHKATA